MFVCNKFSKEKIDFILHMLKKGSVTKKTQSIFRGFGYYLMIWALRDDGLARSNGLTDGREKIWELTEKGVEVAKGMKKMIELDKKIEGIMNA